MNIWRELGAAFCILIIILNCWSIAWIIIREFKRIKERKQKFYAKMEGFKLP